jgi:hypothetical protein
MQFSCPRADQLNISNLFLINFLICALTPVFEARWLRISGAGQMANFAPGQSSR